MSYNSPVAKKPKIPDLPFSPTVNAPSTNMNYMKRENSMRVDMIKKSQVIEKKNAQSFIQGSKSAAKIKPKKDESPMGAR